MEESYILVLLTILILLVVVVGYLAQKRIREIEIETNALKCDFETHVSQVNELLSVQQNGGECDMNDDDIDMSKIQNIMNGNYEELSKQNEEIFQNINNGDLKCIDASDDDDESNCNEGDQLGQVELLNDSSDSEDEEQTLESDMSKLEEQLRMQEEQSNLLDENDNIVLELNNVQEHKELINDEEQKTEHNTKKIKRTSSKKKKTPNVVASSFEEGHEVISENDGKLYRVSQYKSGNKRWVLAK
mgnify:CR=1 FL=1